MRELAQDQLDGGGEQSKRRPQFLAALGGAHGSGQVSPLAARQALHLLSYTKERKPAIAPSLLSHRRLFAYVRRIQATLLAREAHIAL